MDRHSPTIYIHIDTSNTRNNDVVDVVLTHDV